ncbi:MAG: DUF819 family protein [Archangium sp.]|nr:DUF819 family protein [Archangium sp.]MDP3151615.1 DUF819 family protein [Archangium sp.]MDP3569150.1 DUF819 family protein [Archangium sp.]
MNILHLLFCLITPAIAIWAADRFKPAKVLGPVVLSYAAGIVLANIPGVKLDESFGQSLAGGAVLIAIPLLLYSTEIGKWLSLAKSLLLSFLFACIAAVASASMVGWYFRDATDEWWKIAGMLVGVYVGGTANMSAVGYALDVKQETFVVLNTADLIAGGAYLFFLLSLAQRLLSKILPAFKGDAHQEAFEHPGQSLSKWTRGHVKPMGKSFGLTLLIVGASVGLTFLVMGKLHVGLLMLAITTLGLGASLSKKVRSWDGSFELGEYVLLIFCAGMGSLADVSKVTGTSLTLFSFVCIVMVVAAVIHFALCALFRIDVDTAIISSTATIFGPPFIGAVAASLKNRALVGPGLTLGLAGIALGTYLGLATAYALRALAG